MALRYGPRSDRTTTNYLGFDGSLLAGAILARTLWLQGYPDQAVERALLTIKDADALDHPLSLSISLVWAVSVFLWAGDLERADEHINRLLSRAELHSFGPYLAVGHGFQGELAVRQGDAKSGVGELQRCLAELHAAPYELLTTPLNIALVQGLAATGQFREAFALINEAIQSVETNGDACYMPELLRLRGGLALAAPQPDVGEAETQLRLSLELSRHQGARGWELRAALDLAALLAARDERGRARALLQPLFEQFVEGLGTTDLRSAAHMLATLS
jgi:predicted ATPase